MSDKTNTSAEDIDLLYVYEKLKGIVQGWIRLLFKAIDFFLKYWYVVVGLAVVGAGIGYLIQKDEPISKQAKVLVKVNFDAGNYLYNAIEVFDKKINEGDKDFISSVGLDPSNESIYSLELEPIIDVKDITEDFEGTDRNLDALLRYVEFNMEEKELYQTFAYDYNYHILKVSLSDLGTKEDLQKVIDYVNTNEILNDQKNTAISVIEQKIKDNETLLTQIDAFLVEYLRRESEETQVPNVTYYVERSIRPDLLLNSKNGLLLENKELRQELVFYKDAVIPMSGLEVYPIEKELVDNKMVLFPLLLVVGFIIFSLFRNVYLNLRAIANQDHA